MLLYWWPFFSKSAVTTTEFYPHSRRQRLQKIRLRRRLDEQEEFYEERVARTRTKKKKAVPRPTSAIVLLGGNGATTTTGTLTATRTKALTGVGATTPTGTVTPTQPNTVALTGVGATTGTGALLPLIPGQGVIIYVDTQTAFGSSSGGVAVNPEPGWTVTSPINATGTLSCIVHSEDGSYTPQLDQEIVITFNGISNRVFGGFITNIRLSGMGGEGGVPIQSEITASDFNTIATRQYCSISFAGSYTLKQILEVLTPYCEEVALNPAQVDGPVLVDVNFPLWRIDECLNQLRVLTGYVWDINFYKVLTMYPPGSKNAPFSITGTNSAALLDVITEPSRDNYFNSVLVYGKDGLINTVRNAPPAELAAHKVQQMVVTAPDVETQVACDALADSILAASLPQVKRCEYTTLQAVSPGMTQTINLPGRKVNNTFLLTEVIAQHLDNKTLWYTVKAIEGLVYQPGWREEMKGWSNAMGGFSISGAGGGGGGGSANQRYAYFLGGDGTTYVRNETAADWIVPSPMQVQLNTIPRGSLFAQVTCQLSVLQAGGSVQARLYDTTIASACPGISAFVPAAVDGDGKPVWSTVTFVTTLTAGSHYYQLQLLPSGANVDVGAIAYVE